MIEYLSSSALIGVALVGLTTHTPGAYAAVTYETRALTQTEGAWGPGLATGVTFGSFGFDTPLAINSVGQTAFIGRLTGPGVDWSNSYGVWSEGSGSGLAMVARKGSSAPGTAPGVNFGGIPGNDGIRTLAINDVGQIAFGGTLSGVGVTNSNRGGIWSDASGAGLELVARAGSPAPGTAAGVNFNYFGVPSYNRFSFNNAGQIAFDAGLTGPGVVSFRNNLGIWSEGGGEGLERVVRGGDSNAPGTAPFVNFGFFVGAPVLNNSGQIAFAANLGCTFNCSGVDSSNDYGVWSTRGGAGLGLVVREGYPAPGTAAGVNFTFSSLDPKLNDAGQTAFATTVTGPGIDGSNNNGVWSEGGGAGLALVARAGDHAPGTAAGVTFSSLLSQVKLNNAGQTAFAATLTGLAVDSSNNDGIWSQGVGSGLGLVVRKGDPAPGTPDGVTFESLGSLQAQTRFAFNDTGQIAFPARLTGVGIDSTNNTGIWVSDANGSRLIARSGDLFDVNDDPLITDLRTISSAWFPLETSYRGSGSAVFNNKGQLVFSLDFTDGSAGIFVANTVTPGPNSLPGDYNDDGVIDAADYTAWRDNWGAAAGTLPNDAAGGTIGQAQYEQWADNYGALSTNSAAAPTTSVPEPGSAVLLAIAVASGLGRRNRGVRFECL